MRTFYAQVYVIFAVYVNTPSSVSIKRKFWIKKSTEYRLLKPPTKCKAIPVTGRGGPLGCETSRLPRFLDIRLTDGGEGVNLKRPPPFTPQEDSWYSFLLEAESTPGP
jgi:hypothetical protein